MKLVTFGALRFNFIMKRLERGDVEGAVQIEVAVESLLFGRLIFRKKLQTSSLSLSYFC